MIGPTGILRALSYTGMKLLHELAEPAPPAPPEWTGPGRLQEVITGPAGATYRFDRRDLRLRPVWQDTLELDWGPVSERLAPPLHTGPGATFEAALNSFRTGVLELAIRDDGLELFSRGRTLRREALPLFRGPLWRHHIRLRPGESVHGLGERAARFDLRGARYEMWNTDRAGSWGPGADPLYACLPAYLSLPAGGEACLALYDNWARATFDVGCADPGVFAHHFQGGPLRYYLIAGPPAEAVSRLLDLTGRPHLPPLWALGLHQSRWSYPDEESVRRLVEGFERHQIPLSAVHLDIEHLSKYRAFTVETRAFPDLARLCSELLDRGVRVVTIVGPGLKRDTEYPPYVEAARRGFFVRDRGGGILHAPVWAGWSAFPDFIREDVRQWWGQLYRGSLDAGVSGFWHDLNEPQAFVAAGDPTLPANARHGPYRHDEVHNLYPNLMNQAGFEALRRARPARRPFILSRSGWIGVQQQAFLWTGDVESTWAALRQSLRTLLGLAVSGVPFTGSDTGGFSGHPAPELYLRWLQLSSLTPFFRVHSTRGAPPREPWRYGEPWLSYARTAIDFRYALLPYLYTLAWEATTSGLPPLRPLLFADPTLAQVDDAFMLGEAVIVAPVLDEGVREREVALPPGRWYQFWSGAVFDGPGAIRVPAPLERPALLVRGGRIIPLASGGRMGMGASDLALRVFPPADGQAGESVIYTDAGDGHGPGRLDRFTLSSRAGAIRLDWSATGEFPWPYRNVRIETVGPRGALDTLSGASRTGLEPPSPGSSVHLELP